MFTVVLDTSFIFVVDFQLVFSCKYSHKFTHFTHFHQRQIDLPAMKKVEPKILKTNFFGRTAVHMSISIDKPINNNPKIINACVALNLPVEGKMVLIINL